MYGIEFYPQIVFSDTPDYRAGIQSSSNKPAPKSTPSQPASSRASNPADPAPAFGEAKASSYMATKAARDEIGQMLAQNLAGYSPDSAILSGVSIPQPFSGGAATSWQGDLARWIYGNQSSWTGKSALWMLQHTDAIVSTLQSMAELNPAISGSNAVTGVDYLTGQRLGGWDRVWGGLNTVGFFFGGGTGQAARELGGELATSLDGVLTKGMGLFASRNGFASVEETLYHSVASPQMGQSVLDGISLRPSSVASRFGKAFYLSELPETTLAELQYRNITGTDTISYTFNSQEAKVLDLTDPKVAQRWGYEGGKAGLVSRSIGYQARAEGYDAIRYYSLRGEGANLAVLSNFEALLKPQIIVPVPEYELISQPVYQCCFSNTADKIWHCVQHEWYRSLLWQCSR